MSIDGPSSTFGVLCLNKPTGPTSRAVVDRVTRAVGRKIKVGHAGTLDPLASGVLVVCLGAATRLIEYVQRQPKTYRTVVHLGQTSDTLDADGNVSTNPDAADPGLDAISRAISGQVGAFLQRPPAFSALKVDGERAYDLARAGKTVELAPRPVTVHKIEVLDYEWPRLALEIVCEGGTYIRSIARDIGEAVGCGGLVAVLERTRIGAFSIAEAVDPMSLTPESIRDLILPATLAVAQLPRVAVSADQVSDLARGRSLTVPEAPAGELALIGPDGLLVAIAESDPASGRVAPRRVLVGI